MKTVKVHQSLSLIIF